MHTSFLPETNQSNSAAISLQSTTDGKFGREYIKILVIGSPRGVTSIIHTLHSLHFAEVGEWTPLQPHGTSGEVMSLLRRQIVLG